jgi:F-box protein 16
LTIKIWPHLLI